MARKPAIDWTFGRGRHRTPNSRFVAMVEELKAKGYLAQDGSLTDKGHAYCREVCRDND